MSDSVFFSLSLSLSHIFNCRYGIVFIDLAFYKTEWKRHNGNNVGFVVGVEASTLQLSAVPVRSKKRDEWQRAVETIAEKSAISNVRCFVSDLEPAITSRNFRKEMRDKKGIVFHFLHKKSKSYLAECYIRWIKSALSKVCEERKSVNGSYKKWVEVLPQVVASFNQRKVRGTNYVRKDIDRDNYYDFLSKVFKVKDATLLLNAPTIKADKIFSKKWSNRFFRFKLGERVLVSKRASGLYNEDSAFPKPSVHGAFLKGVYVITERLLKKNLDWSMLVPGKY